MAPATRCSSVLGPVLLAIASCGPSSCSPRTSAESQARLDALVAALTPPGAEAPSAARDAWYRRRAELASPAVAPEPPEVGRLALELLRERPPADPSVRKGLLESASRSLGRESAPALVELFERYETPLDLRAAACLLLADVDPERAVELLEPLVVDTRPNRTLPPAEDLLTSWSRACVALERSRTAVLARVATDIYQDDRARTVAIELLGGLHGSLERQALETVLVESTGNGLLRRKAAQALERQLPPAEACAIFRRVLDLEVDLNFQIFLADLVERACP